MTLERVAILGLGRVGRRIAERLRARGSFVRGSRRVASPDPAADEVVAADLADPASLRPLLAGVSALVAAAAPGPGGHDLVYGSGLRSLLRAAREARVERVIVLGSVSVYGEDGGAIVDESTPPAPGDAAGRALLEGERATRDAGGLVLRLAGLYARGRGPQSVLAAAPRDPAGRPLLGGSSGRWLNLVHEADAAAAAVLALERWEVASRSPVLNVADGRPVTRGEFYGALARAFGWPEPSFQLADPGRGKRVNVSSLSALGFVPALPSFADAVRADELTLASSAR